MGGRLASGHFGSAGDHQHTAQDPVAVHDVQEWEQGAVYQDQQLAVAGDTSPGQLGLAPGEHLDQISELLEGNRCESVLVLSNPSVLIAMYIIPQVKVKHLLRRIHYRQCKTRFRIIS